MTKSRRARTAGHALALTATVTAAVLGITGTLAAPAVASTTGALPEVVPTAPTSTQPSALAATPADTPVTLTVVLTPRDRPALRRLGTTVIAATGAELRERVDATAPRSGGRAVVRNALVDAGFTVTRSGTWEFSATGTVGQAEALLDVDVVGTGDAMHPTREPVMPAAFAGKVSSVLGLDQRPVVVPSAVPGRPVRDLAAAYSAPADPDAGAGATIATMQFSGWRSSDLDTYAAAAGTALPSVTEIGIAGASPTQLDGKNGDVEVALDQEALLAVAPAAAQRIYFVPSTVQGMYEAYTRIADDVATHRISTLSTSWGICEATLPAQYRTVLEDGISRVVAAGATMFAASGDTGTSCGGMTSVNYPASSPAVIGVGGTTLEGSGSSFTETAWGNANGSSGGGRSAAARPAYQAGTGLPGTDRLVPDVSAVADPASGIGIYTATLGGWVLGGGTSLASPILAAQLTTILTARGCSAGVGDVHDVLYANPGAFRDVTSGDNGTDPATVGYDLVTGLGTPDWSALAEVLPTASSCPAAPTVTAPVSTPTATPTAAPTTTPKATPAPAPAPTPTPTPTATATPKSTGGVSKDGTTITAGTVRLPGGTSIHSPSRQYRLDMQTDGNLVEYGNGRALWQSRTSGNRGATLALQPDGNLVVYSRTGTPLWNTRTNRTGSSNTLTVTDRGDVRVRSGNTVRWHNGAPGADTMTPGSSLTAGQSLWDTAGKRQLVMQADGNLVLYIGGRAKWASHTTRYPGVRFTLQADGNLVVYDKRNQARWASQTSRFRGTGMRLVVQRDGNAVLYQGKTARWSTRTKG